jgi:hypothetical protein
MLAMAQAVANATVSVLGRIIPYVNGGKTVDGFDCQGFIKWAVEQAGGKASYSGSNAMFRECNANRQLWTWADAAAKGKLVPGALAFILEHDGSEPDHYKDDGLGNASHVGVAVLHSNDVYTVDASSSYYQKTGGTIHTLRMIARMSGRISAGFLILTIKTRTLRKTQKRHLSRLTRSMRLMMNRARKLSWKRQNTRLTACKAARSLKLLC